VFECDGDILVRLFSYEELANPVTEDFKDISNIARKFVKFFVLDQMEKSKQDIFDTLKPDCAWYVRRR